MNIQNGKNWLWILGLAVVMEMGCGNQGAVEKAVVEDSVVVEDRPVPEEEPLVLKDKDFEAFYERFIHDSAYQVAHLRFPMGGGYSGHDDERGWTKKEWPVMRWDMRDRSLKETPDDQIVLEEKGDTVFYGNYCGGCGFSFEMRFEKAEGEWWLVYRQENNF